MLAAVSDLEASTLRKVEHHLIPFVAVLFFAAFINRANVGVAAAQMNRDLGFSAYVYGLGAERNQVLPDFPQCAGFEIENRC